MVLLPSYCMKQDRTLEEAYVSLTSNKARARSEDDKKESKLAKWWRRFLTGSTPDYKEVSEDE